MEQRYASIITFSKDTEPRVAGAVLKALVAQRGHGEVRIPERTSTGALTARIEFYAEEGEQETVLRQILTLDDDLKQDLERRAAEGTGGFIPGDSPHYQISETSTPERQ